MDPQQDMDAIIVGPPTMQIRVRRDGPLICFDLLGEVLSDDVVGAMRMAEGRGWLGPDSRMLFDLTLYAGSIEWKILRQLLDMPCWGAAAGRRMHAAYVVRDGLWSAVIRVFSTHFEGTRHAAFTSAAQARHWLLPHPGAEATFR